METALPADLTAADVSTDDLAALQASLLAEFDAQHDSGTPDLAVMTEIANALDAVDAEVGRRDAESAEQAAAIEALAARVRPAAASGDAEGDDAPDENATEGADAEGAAAPEPVTAAGRNVTSPKRAPGASAAAVRRQAGTQAPINPAMAATTITAAAELPGHNLGAQLSVLDVAKGFHDKARGLADGGNRVLVASVNLPIPEADKLGSNLAANLATLDRVTDSSKLLIRENGMARVASGGWCAPTQTTYELFSIDAADALFDLPTVGIERSGITMPDFMDYNTASSALWTWTEQNDIDAVYKGRVLNKALTTNVATLTTDIPHGLSVGDTVVVTGVDSTFNGSYVVASVPTTTTFTYAKTAGNVASATASGFYSDSTGELTKPCVRINCPTFSEYILEAEGLCVTHGNLSDRAYPELTRKFVALVMNLHLNRVSNAVLNKVIATATAVGPITTTSDAAGDILFAIELQASDYRSQYLMSDNAVLEAVFPLWTAEVIRATLSMRAGVPLDHMNVTDAQIEGWFASRGIRPQFVQGYQILWNGTPRTSWPTSLKFLIYPAGGYVKGTGPSIDLGVVRDSVLNSTNDFTAAWSEQFYLVAQRGPDAREVTVNISVDGVTACCP